MGRLIRESGGPISIPSAKQTRFQETQTYASTLICACMTFLLLSCSRQITKPPQVVAVSVCRDVAHGMHRITSDFGIRFDAPEKVFVVHEALRDMPPGMMYIVRLRDTDAHIVFWHDDDIFRDLKSAYPVFSKRVEERAIRDAVGGNFGTDQWGYLPDGERWRYIIESRII
jgi:hypothetical protein